MRISDWSSDVCSSDLARKTDQDAPADIHIKLRYLQARFYGTDAWVERSAAGDEICLITGAAEIDTPGAHQRLDAPGECLRWTAAGAQRLSASEAGTLLPRDRKSTRLNSSH